MTEEPTTTAELLARIERSRRALDSVLSNLSDDQLTAPGPAGGWSVKDHLTHLTAWEAGIAALLRKKPRYEAMGIDAATFRNDEDRLNAIIHEQKKERPLDDVRAAFTSTQREMAETISALSDEDLQRTYSYYQPDEPGEDSGDPIVGWITGNTCDHYDEHRGYIEELIE